MSDRTQLRPILLIGIPALLIATIAYLYFTGDRYVSTDNAYAKADMVSVSPDVGGRIVEVFVKENQFVKAGDPLFQIDPAPYRIALAQADAQLATATANVKALRAKYQMTMAQLDLSASSIAYYKREFERQSTLAKRSFASQSSLDTARHNLDTASQLDGVLRQSLEQISAQLDGAPDAPVESHASYLAAKAQRDNAALNLERATVRAPFDGVTGKQPQVGDQIAPGMAVVSLVSHDNVWIEGNFKETDLTNVHPGQIAEIDIDTYPGRKWSGHVASISQATGSEFSVLPAQNATGNWVKVVQRVPVRIAIDRKPGDPEIRAGMSANVEIDTKSQAIASTTAASTAK
ncbi:HlyD family secretion protein [Parvibaculum sp.]|uniref:HlyD family secretion protein n=1 Tax=Parvibaculum sp. TaxID=2024848 RepID=UPI00320FFAD9